MGGSFRNSMNGVSFRRCSRRRVASAAVLVLALFSFAGAPSTLAVGVAAQEEVAGKANESPEAENAAADKEGVSINNEQQVCRSDAAGVMNCRAPSNDERERPSESTIDGENFQCNDLHEECPTWAERREYDANGNAGEACEMNSAYMAHYCPVSCDTCDIVRLGHRLSTMLEGGLAVIPFCQDNDISCRTYAESGECHKNPEYMNMFCEASCEICSEESNEFGVGQKLQKEDPEKRKVTMERLARSIEYMMGTVKQDRKYSKARDHCLNKVPDCTLWAAHGECDKNPEYMKFMCAPACMSCDYMGDTSES